MRLKGFAASEVGGQVVIGIAEAGNASHPDLLAAQPVPLGLSAERRYVTARVRGPATAGGSDNPDYDKCREVLV